jgi:hypothetical protein
MYTTPLLVWIDDAPSNNQSHIRRAVNLGIHVELILSTSKAKEWIDQNAGTALGPFFPPNVRLSSSKQLR